MLLLLLLFPVLVAVAAVTVAVIIAVAATSRSFYATDYNPAFYTFQAEKFIGGGNVLDACLQVTLLLR